MQFLCAKFSQKPTKIKEVMKLKEIEEVLRESFWNECSDTNKNRREGLSLVDLSQDSSRRAFVLGPVSNTCVELTNVVFM